MGDTSKSDDIFQAGGNAIDGQDNHFAQTPGIRAIQVRQTAQAASHFNLNVIQGVDIWIAQLDGVLVTGSGSIRDWCPLIDRSA